MLDPKTRREVRKAANASRNNIPVKVVPGPAAPQELGEGFCYRTKGGELIRHPSAYGRKGRSNMVYHCSNLRVEVGEEWLVINGFSDT
jgi:hypothetical protein